MSVIIRTEDGERQIALEDRVRARMFRARRGGSDLVICHLDFELWHFIFRLQPQTSFAFL